MKKIIILFLTIFAANHVSTGQTFHFPDSNAIWSVWNEKYFVSGDSIYNSTLYKKYYFSHDSIPSLTNSIFIALLREDTTAKRVYAIRKDSIHERIIYDFSLADNDTLTVFPFSFFPYETSGIRIRVEQHDSILIGGQYRKRLKVIGLDQNTNIPEYWIEGIGSTFGPFNGGLTGHVVFDITYPFLLCFEQDSTLLYDNPSYSYCYGPYPYGIFENQIINDITIYPNPAQNLISIASDSEIHDCRLFSSNGRVVLYSDISTSKYSIDISMYPNGIYMLYIETDKGITTKKILKSGF
jgi:hypothetical protein